MRDAVTTLQRAEWQRIVPNFLDYNYRQAWDFGVACAERLGAASEHVAVVDGSCVLGLADVRIKRIPLLGTGIAYITGGPLVRRRQTSATDHLDCCLQSLIAEYVDRRRLVLRILPSLGDQEWNAAQTEAFSRRQFGIATQPAPYRTILVDVSRPIDEVRASLAQKWRNCLNRAEKNGLTVRSGKEPELFEEFCALYRGLLERKQFTVELHADFYAQVHRRLADCDRFHVTLASLNGQPVAGHVASVLGDTAVYLLGASSEESLRTKASYLLQWHAIQTAREHGCQWYDLGGIDPEANPGVYHFKQGMGGVDVTSPGPFEMRPRGLAGQVALAAECLYRMSRRIRKA